MEVESTDYAIVFATLAGAKGIPAAIVHAANIETLTMML